MGVLKLAALLAASVQAADVTYTVSVTGTSPNYYNLTDESGNTLTAPDLNLEQGKSYKFQDSGSVFSSHPFKIGTAAEDDSVGSHDGMNVALNSDHVLVTVGATTTVDNIYYYYCDAHAGMGGQITIAAAATAAPVVLATSVVATPIPCDKKFEFELVTPGAGNVTVARLADDDHYWHNLKDIAVNGIDLTIFHFNDLIFLCDFTATPQEFARDQGEWKQKLCSDDSANPWSDGYCSVYTDFSNVANATEKGFISLTIPQLKAQLAAR